MKTNISPPPAGGADAARVDWNTVPMVNSDELDAQLIVSTWTHRAPPPAPTVSNRRKILWFVAPILVGIVLALLTGCTSTPGDIAKYAPGGGKAGGSMTQAQREAIAITPQVLRPTEIPTPMPPLPPPDTTFQSPAPTVVGIPVSSALSGQPQIIQYGEEAGAWTLVLFFCLASFVGGVIVGLLLGGRRG